MHEKKILQEFELTDHEISRSRSLLPLKARNTYTNMGRRDHVHIVSTITNRERGLCRESISHYLDNIRFLFW